MSGLMKPTPQPDDLMAAIRRDLGPASNESRTLEERLKSLSEADLQAVLSTARLVKMMARWQSESYQQIVDQSYPRMAANLRYLIAEMLQDADPLPDVPKTVTTPRVDPREQALSEYAAILFEQPNDTAKGQPNEQGELSSGITSNDDFLARLTQSESSGDSNAEITIKDGRRFVGSLQFGESRLKDYQAATGKSFTQDEFKANPALQDEVGLWHITDLDEAIDALGDAAKGYDRDGLRSVAHLGGKSGMRKFVRSNGDYNPSDELGTSLKDYYDKFSSKT